MKVYLIYEINEFELPIAVFDSIKECAEYLNCKPTEIVSTCAKLGYGFEVVRL